MITVQITRHEIVLICQKLAWLLSDALCCTDIPYTEEQRTQEALELSKRIQTLLESE